MLEIKEIEEIVTKHMPMIFKNVKKYNIGNHSNLEDIISDGRLCLIERAQTYDPSKGAFQTHSFLYLRNAMLKSIANASSCFNFNDIAIMNMYKKGVTTRGTKHSTLEVCSMSQLCNPHKNDINNPQNVGDTLAVYDKDLDAIFDDVPNLLDKALAPLEIKMIKLLYVPFKDRRGNWREQDMEIARLVSQLTGKKLRKTCTTYYKKDLKRKLTAKVYNYYKHNGYPDAKMPEIK